MSVHLLVLVRLLKHSALAMALALAYAWWDYLGLPEASQTTSGFIRSFCVAFFLCMFFVGQWDRAARQVTDAEQLAAIKPDTEATKAAIRVKRGADWESARQLPIADAVAAALLADAEAAIDAGLKRTGLITASVALDHALRRFAKSHRVIIAASIPVPRILNRLRENKSMDPALVEDMHVLWRVRNAVVRGNSEEFLRSAQANQLYEGFRWAVGYLCDGFEDAQSQAAQASQQAQPRLRLAGQAGSPEHAPKSGAA